MHQMPHKLKKPQAIILALMVCTLGACAEDTRDKHTSHIETASDSNKEVSSVCEHFHSCLDSLRITTLDIFVKKEGRFSRIGIDLPKKHEIKNALEVNGKILAEEILVEAVVADYVFTPTYDLKPLEFVEGFINEHHHLPGIPSSTSVEAAGGKIAVGDSYRGLLEKIEELTLYTIDQDKRIAELEKLLISQYKIKGSSSADY